MRIQLKTIAFALLTGAMTLFSIEVALSLAARVSPRVGSVLGTVPSRAPDDRLGNRLNPDLFGIDENGFRNPRVPVRADVVALGDSQTYGVGVLPWDAWPPQLEQMTGQTVYSMAIGGYGPVHSLILLDEALSLEPTTVIEAFYSGNDLYDAFRIVYGRGQHPELRSRDEAVQVAIAAADAEGSVRRRVRRLYEQVAPVSSAPPRFSLSEFVMENSKLVALIEAAGDKIGDGLRASPRFGAAWGAIEWHVNKRAADRDDLYTDAAHGSGWSTVFTPAYRGAALDMDDPRIREGHRICLEAIRQMNERSREHGARFVVLLIPTKELVFSPEIENPSPAMAALIEQENSIWQRSREFFDRHEIRYIDSLPALQAQLASGAQPYPRSDSGHPSRPGYAAIARLVRDTLAQ